MNDYNKKYFLFGNKVKELRVEKNYVQRQLAEQLEIDIPMYSKIELGIRRAKRSQVIKLAEFLQADTKEMLSIWLADNVLVSVRSDMDLFPDATHLAQEAIKMRKIDQEG